MMAKKKQTPDYFKNMIVVQKNDFLRGNTKYFTLNDLKFLKLIISKIHLNDRKKNLFSEYYEITNDEVKHLNINEKHLRREILNILKRLSSIFVTIESKEGERIVGLIKNDFFMPAYQKTVRISLNADMERYLLVNNNYTKYLLSDIVEFKYKHTLKLYEYMKSIDLEFIKFEYSSLRKVLELTDSYLRDPDFKKVINNSVNEINDKARSISLIATFEKNNKDFLVLFQICRYEGMETSLDINSEPTTNTIEEPIRDYTLLINEECKIKGAKYTLKNILNNKESEEFSISLKEQGKNTVKEFVFENYENLLERLKALFEESYHIESLESVRPLIESIPSSKKKETKSKEIKTIESKEIESLQQFKKRIIEKYTGVLIANNVPGFLEDQELFLNNGGLITKSDGTIIDKEKAFIAWDYLYNNQEIVGVRQKIQPIVKYIGTELSRPVENLFFNTKDILRYVVHNIEKEGIEQYRLYLKNEAGEIEVAKNPLTYKQLATLMVKKKLVA